MPFIVTPPVLTGQHKKITMRLQFLASIPALTDKERITLIYEVTGDDLTLDSKGGEIDNPKTEKTNSSSALMEKHHAESQIPCIVVPVVSAPAGSCVGSHLCRL